MTDLAANRPENVHVLLLWQAEHARTIMKQTKWIFLDDSGANYSV